MSRARRQYQALAKQIFGDKKVNADKMAIAPATPAKIHKMFLQTPKGVMQFAVPDDDMKCCPCGCSYFRPVFKICFVKPGDVIGAEPILCRTEIFLCDKCEQPLEVSHPQIGQLVAGAALTQGDGEDVGKNGSAEKSPAAV